MSFVLSSLWLSGGVMVVIELANRLAARGHHVALVAPSNASADTMLEMVQPSVEVLESPAGRGPGDGHIAHLGLALSLARTVPNSDVIVSTHTPTTLPAWIAGRVFSRTALVWLFMDYAQMFEERPIEAWLLRHAGDRQDAAMAISQATVAELQGYTATTIHHVGWGLSHAERLTPCFVEDRPNGDRAMLLYVGDDRPRKGMADFLAAAEVLAVQGRQIELQIVCRTGCTVSSSVPHTVHVAAATETLLQLYHSCKCLVMAAWSEGLSNPPLEAMACATPVVLTAAGGPAEYAIDGENCLVVPPQDPRAMAAAIARLLDDFDLARRLSYAGPATVARYQWEPVVDRVERCLQEVTAQPRGSWTRLRRAAAP